MSAFDYEFRLAMARQMDPVERLDALVLGRTIHSTEHGFGMWCYGCKQVVCVRPFEADADWFEDLTWRRGDSYNNHVAACPRLQPPAGEKEVK